MAEGIVHGVNELTQACLCGEILRNWLPVMRLDTQKLEPNSPETRDEGKVNIADQLKKFVELKNKGILSQAEFDQQKARLLEQPV